MRPPLWIVTVLWIAAACGKSAFERQRDVGRCSERSSDALEIQLCLESEHGWKTAEAGPAAATRAHELDSLQALRADSAWAAEAARHRTEIRQCAGPDLPRCLLIQFGWPQERAAAAADSVWAANASTHRREVEACTRQRENVSSCLVLRYKWPSDRALKANDSILRARMAR
jgi:hypothetical protein